MTKILTVDAAGRLVLPKAMREKMHLQAGSKVRAEMVGDHVELTVEPAQTRVTKGKNGLPVVVGWNGFDAGKAVKETRSERDDQLARHHRS